MFSNMAHEKQHMFANIVIWYERCTKSKRNVFYHPLFSAGGSEDRSQSPTVAY